MKWNVAIEKFQTRQFHSSSQTIGLRVYRYRRPEFHVTSHIDMALELQCARSYVHCDRCVNLTPDRKHIPLFFFRLMRVQISSRLYTFQLLNSCCLSHPPELLDFDC